VGGLNWSYVVVRCSLPALDSIQRNAIRTSFVQIYPCQMIGIAVHSNNTADPAVDGLYDSLTFFFLFKSSKLFYIVLLSLFTRIHA
jgi:hypothetical protein